MVKRGKTDFLINWWETEMDLLTSWTTLGPASEEGMPLACFPGLSAVGWNFGTSSSKYLKTRIHSNHLPRNTNKNVCLRQQSYISKAACLVFWEFPQDGGKFPFFYDKRLKAACIPSVWMKPCVFVKSVCSYTATSWCFQTLFKKPAPL